MRIRPESESNFGEREIYELVKVAFQTAKVSNGKEQDFVTQLRNSPDYIPELALVAEGDIIIGTVEPVGAAKIASGLVPGRA